MVPPPGGYGQAKGGTQAAEGASGDWMDGVMWRRLWGGQGFRKKDVTYAPPPPPPPSWGSGGGGGGGGEGGEPRQGVGHQSAELPIGGSVGGGSEGGGRGGLRRGGKRRTSGGGVTSKSFCLPIHL